MQWKRPMWGSWKRKASGKRFCSAETTQGLEREPGKEKKKEVTEDRVRRVRSMRGGGWQCITVGNRQKNQLCKTNSITRVMVVNVVRAE